MPYFYRAEEPVNSQYLSKAPASSIGIQMNNCLAFYKKKTDATIFKAIVVLAVCHAPEFLFRGSLY